ncbi:MAG: hypothetical protein ACRCXA_07280 [Peptostreptococcaceae bacterium]
MNFSFAKVTNSRLMGSLGLVVCYENGKDGEYKYFLLDSEGLGIADYVSLMNPSKEEAYMEQQRLMGGLGSDVMNISEDQALFLIKHFGNKTIEWEKELPGNVDEYIDIIKNYQTDLTIQEMYPIICKEVKEEIEFINYMTMRFIGWDRECLKYFSDSDEISNMHITSINGTLLKNTVLNKGDGKFVSEALFEDEDGYYTCKIAFSITKKDDRFKISSMLIGEKESVYDFEVFDEISKEEFICVYDLVDKENFLEDFYKDNSFALRSEMEEGILFTRFNFNNEHVKEEIYVINNDLKSVYYQMGNEFFVGTYNERDRKYINKLLCNNYKDYLKVKDEYYFEENALYDFAESGSTDFEDFLN